MLNQQAKEITFTRILNAPRELVFKAWTDETHMAQWWGPKGFTNPVCTMDVRPDGSLYIAMTAPNGMAYPTKGTFHEISEPGRLVFTTTAFDDEHGTPGIEMLNTVTFEEQDGKTKLTLRVTPVKVLPAFAEAVTGMNKGWNESLDRLTAVVECV